MKLMTLMALAIFSFISAQLTYGQQRHVTECLYNTDCAYPLSCKARMCQIECRTDNDCDHGYRCGTTLVNSKTFQRCLNPKITGEPFAQLVTELPQTNINYFGNDIASRDIPYQDINEQNTFCIQACKETPQCQAYTIVAPGVHANRAMCYLKSAVSDTGTDVNTRSGRIK
jgi:hypothetical protein